MLLIVHYKKPFKLDINEMKTLLDLKKEIASHFNQEYTQFNIMNGNDIIDSTKDSCTLKSLNIKRLIRLPKNYNPGKIFRFQ